MHSICSSSWQRAILLPLSIFCRQNGVKPPVIFLLGSNWNMCCLISLKVSFQSMKFMRAFPCCASSRRSSRAWILVIGSLLLLRMWKISGTSSWMVRPQKPRRLKQLVPLRIFVLFPLSCSPPVPFPMPDCCCRFAKVA